MIPFLFTVWSEDSWLREHTSKPDDVVQNGTEAADENGVYRSNCISH